MQRSIIIAIINALNIVPIPGFCPRGIHKIKSIGFIQAFIIAGGNRAYYAFTSLMGSLQNPLSFPGDWSGNFVIDLMNSNHYLPQ